MLEGLGVEKLWGSQSWNPVQRLTRLWTIGMPDTSSLVLHCPLLRSKCTQGCFLGQPVCGWSIPRLVSDSLKQCCDDRFHVQSERKSY